MPHVEGESLRQRLSREGQIPLASARAHRPGSGWRAGLRHRQHVVHRDIKPENILLQEGQAIVADFGIARAIDAGVVDAGATATIPALGTPAYMSPEQATRTAGIDGRTDIYALGCVLYENAGGCAARSPVPPCRPFWINAHGSRAARSARYDPIFRLRWSRR